MKKKISSHFDKIVIGFLLILLSIKAYGGSVILNESIDTIFDISEYTTIYIDKSASLDYESIRRMQKKGAFSSLNTMILEGKYTRGKYNYWLHFKLANESADKFLRPVYRCGKHYRIEFYQQRNDSLTIKKSGSSHRIIDKSRLFPNKYSLLLDLPPKTETTVYVKITGDVSLTTPNSELLGERYEFESAAQSLWVFYGFYIAFFSLLIFVFIFTLPQYLQNKEKSFLYYSLYVATLFFFYYRDFDINNPIIQNLPLWISEYKYYIPISLIPFLAYLLFVSSFLNTKDDFPKIHKLIRFSVICLGIYLVIDRVCIFFDEWLAWRLDNMLRLGFLAFSIYFLILLIRAKSILARYILCGTLVLVLASFTNMLLSVTSTEIYKGYWNFTLIPQFIGIGLELLFFSLGLGYKTKLLEYDKNIAQINLEKEKRQIIHQKELNKLQNSFFANISHELRTPLTVIMGLAEEVMRNSKYQLNRRLELIKKNGLFLLTLVNQILDLSKLEAKAMTLDMVQADIIRFLKVMVDSVHSYATSKNISLQFHSEVKQLDMDFDPKFIQQILSNLLSNAIKFTPDYGSILVAAKHVNHSAREGLELMVKDSGIGIKTEDIEHIFDRFYRVEDETEFNSQGTGIGLALVKDMVELVNGEIEVESEIGHGTKFIVRIPILRASIKKQIAPSVVELVENGLFDPSSLHTRNENEWVDPQNDLPLVLVIDDNHDLLYYLESCLSENWNVLTMSSSEKGILKAKEIIPDVIISDVMMPILDGLQLCQKLKSDERTSHIPILLLTAKTGERNKLDGLTKGADAYIIKPFDREELLIRMDNLLKSKKRIQAYLKAIPEDETDDSPEFLFLQKVNTVIENQLDNIDFKIANLSRQLGLSRVQLYRKIKAISGTSPAIYIRNYRLQKARHLLKTKDTNVSEIAWQTGFANLSWFSQAYRELFDESPTETRK